MSDRNEVAEVAGWVGVAVGVVVGAIAYMISPILPVVMAILAMGGLIWSVVP